MDNFASIIDHSAFRYTGRTVIYHFGAGETARDPRVTEIITSYLYRGDYNVIVIDYSDVSVISDEVSGCYGFVFENVRFLLC